LLCIRTRLHLRATRMSASVYSLPALPYAYDVCPCFPTLLRLCPSRPVTSTDVNTAFKALEPSISAQIMELHHSKHHQTYVNNLNAALRSYATASSSGDIAGQIALQGAIKFNGGGHINHSLFWENLAPASSSEAGDPQGSAPTLIKEIARTWGGLQEFKTAFTKVLLGLQGSGWGWMVRDGSQLRIITTKDQDPVVGGEVPILAIDFWEHAYYLQVGSIKLGIASKSF